VLIFLARLLLEPFSKLKVVITLTCCSHFVIGDS